MPSKEFLAAMKANIKTIFPHKRASGTTQDFTATKTISITYLNRGSIEHVEYAFTPSHHRTATPTKSIFKTTTAYDSTIHCYTATIHIINDIHPALRDNYPLFREEKKSRPYNINGTRLEDLKIVELVPEEHLDVETKLRVKKQAREMKEERERKARQERERREREAAGVETRLKKYFDFEISFPCFGKKKEGFELKAVREVPTAEGNGAIFR